MILVDLQSEKLGAPHRTAQGAPLKSARERMDIISAYREVGTYRGAAAMIVI